MVLGTGLFGLGPTELIIILAIVLLLFGPKKLPEIGKAIGSGIRELKKGAEGKDEEPAKTNEKSKEEAKETKEAKKEEE
ncbi:twin-arginine translocase TatA/TatE family subunit [Candidatus Oleimmundimicrobium sp.]|uniref:twin-arginine translocase TatA/TatE family subunit n=1 Tax=Candidatus Oleimmundimicrobium sp. TaxID=3060597 RepID=UPI002A4E20E2|nr:twin-arginine translocase TatA/TatE family subunit [Candidatus Oleimmundimicrobium sp.]